MLVLKIAILITLLFIAFQDFKYKAVLWIWFPILFLLIISKEITELGINTSLNYFIFNLSFIIVQLILLTFYFSVKHKKLINIINKILGLGDILFLVALAAYFSPINFILFLISSLTIVLITYGLGLIFNKIQNKQIPLAGAIAIIMFLLVLIDCFPNNINYYNDTPIINLLDLSNA